MSFGTIADYNAIAALQGGKDGQAKAGKNGMDATLQKAFNTQMRMAQSLFGEGSQVYGEGSSTGSFDTSLINDSMMMEALSTITRLMRTEAGLPQRGSAPTVSSQSPQETVARKQQSAYEPGALSARFESGSGGVATIGYDRVGGTSYGKYQIASAPGTMDRFLEYLDGRNPEWAQQLREAGPANTGSKSGGMPSVWQQLAKENPAAFEKVQHDFIASETYDPARDMILKQTGLDFDNAPPALREVLWSTAVQHGPTGASRIFGKVIDQFVGALDKGEFNSKLIEGVYNSRKGQFGSSTQRVQEAVTNRLNQEKELALNMLGHTPLSKIV